MRFLLHRTDVVVHSWSMKSSNGPRQLPSYDCFLSRWSLSSFADIWHLNAGLHTCDHNCVKSFILYLRSSPCCYRKRDNRSHISSSWHWWVRRGYLDAYMVGTQVHRIYVYPPVSAGRSYCHLKRAYLKLKRTSTTNSILNSTKVFLIVTFMFCVYPKTCEVCSRSWVHTLLNTETSWSLHSATTSLSI